MNKKVEQAIRLSEELGHTNGAVIVVDGFPTHTIDARFDENQFIESFEESKKPSNVIKDEAQNKLPTTMKQAALLTTMISSLGIGAVFAKSDDNKTIDDSNKTTSSVELTVGDSYLKISDSHTYRLAGSVITHNLVERIFSPIDVVYAQEPVGEMAVHRLYSEIYKFMKDFEPTERSFKQASQWAETGNEVLKDIPENERKALIAGLKEARDTIYNFKKSEISIDITQLDTALVRTGMIEKGGKMPYQSVMERTNNIVNIQEELIKNYNDIEKRHRLMEKELTELNKLTEDLSDLEPLIKLSEIEGTPPYIEEFNIREGLNQRIDVKVHKNAEEIDIKVKRIKPELGFLEELLFGPEYRITVKFPVYDTRSGDLVGWQAYTGTNELKQSTTVFGGANQFEKRYDVLIPVEINVVDHGGDMWFFGKGPTEADIKLMMRFGPEKTRLSNGGKYLKGVKDVMTPLTEARIKSLENELSEKPKPIVKPSPTTTPVVKPKETPKPVQSRYKVTPYYVDGKKIGEFHTEVNIDKDGWIYPDKVNSFYDMNNVLDVTLARAEYLNNLEVDKFYETLLVDPNVIEDVLVINRFEDVSQFFQDLNNNTIVRYKIVKVEDLKPKQTGIEYEVNFVCGFRDWKKYKSIELQIIVEDFCERYDVNFFDAYIKIKSDWKLFIDSTQYESLDIFNSMLFPSD